MATTAICSELAESERVQEIELEVLNLETSEELRPIRIASHLPPPFRHGLITILQYFWDVFAWAHIDLPGLDVQWYQHKIHLKNDAKPVVPHEPPLRGESSSGARQTLRSRLHPAS